MIRTFIINLIILFLFSTSYAYAIFGNVGLDPSFCQLKSVRQTIVYINDMLMIEGKTDWANKLASKLKASLAPGERTSVVRLSPSDGHSKEIWAGCWPDYSAEQRAVISKETYLVSKNPLDALEEQQGFFVRDFGAAVSKIYAESKRQESKARFAPEKRHRNKSYEHSLRRKGVFLIAR